MTGEQLESEIFIGPTYYMRLKHMVKDKINFRALGPRTALTKQPVSGRANDGGLRIGEMERDSVVSHGIVNFLTESMMERGDKYKIAVCNTTGLLAIYNPSKNLFLSPMADGPIKFVGSLDGKDMNIENVSKFGRSFSVLSVPYSFKLLIQELQTINVQMRIITDDNINQIESMSFSRNIENLGGTLAPNVIKHKIQGILDVEQKSFPDVLVSPSSPDFGTPDYSSPYTESPAPFVPDSPAPSVPYTQNPIIETQLPPVVNTQLLPVDYEPGEIAIYTGDNQEWMIDKVGNDLVTIENDKGEQKIVGKNELRAYVDGGSAPNLGENHPNLYFAPTINIGGTGGMPIMPPNDGMQPNGVMPIQMPTQIQMPMPMPALDGGFGGIDFNNLVINKHGA
jgi:hypothetical protein